MRVENTFWYGGILPVQGTEWGQWEHMRRFRHCMSQWAGRSRNGTGIGSCLEITKGRCRHREVMNNLIIIMICTISFMSAPVSDCPRCSHAVQESPLHPTASYSAEL
jgi:hypothetical protein